MLVSTVKRWNAFPEGERGWVEILKDKDIYHLTAEATGEKLNPLRHELLVDVKAVTLHRFTVKQTPEGWEATVILDI